MTLQWSPESIHDLIALRAHISDENPAAAKRVALHILYCVEHLLSQHPVSTASKSLTWRITLEQVRIGFDRLDERSEIIDAVGREGRYRLFPGAENGEAAVLRVHIDADLL